MSKCQASIECPRRKLIESQGVLNTVYIRRLRTFRLLEINIQSLDVKYRDYGLRISDYNKLVIVGKIK